MTKITDDLAERGVEVLKRIAVATLSLDDASFISGWVHDARNALRAQGGVRVKPLEWVDIGEGPRCITVCGMYAIYPSLSRGSPTLSLSGMPKGLFSKFASIDAAKAAAQADYERRVLSSLEASPAPVSEPVRAALCAIHRKLAEEGGGTWATYMMIEIASAYNDLEIVEPIEASLAAKGGQ